MPSMRSPISDQGARFTLPKTAPGLLSAPTKLRLGMLSFGLFLALAGIWLLVPELLAPKPVGLPLDRSSASAAAIDAPRTLAAARAAQIRGDLWAQAAFADASLLWLDRPAALDRSNLERIERARAHAETALALAPINGEAWLFLAALPGPESANDKRMAALLQMSYFTAPADVRIAPRRLERAAATAALSDPDIREFAKGDIDNLLSAQPPLKQAIIAAYRNALPQNHALLETLVGDVDPAFAQFLRSGQPK